MSYQIVVRDAASIEDISDAFIQNKRTGNIYFTDYDGQANVVAREGDSLFVSVLGYYDIYAVTGKNRSITIYVTHEPFVNVTIYGTRRKTQTYDSKIILTPETIKKQVLLAGESDPIRALQFVSGVGNTREGMSGLVVRGGLPDQNLLLVDGIRIYNYTHLFGFLSFFNDDAIKDMSFYKSGIPAEYGGRASSVVNINLKDGHPEDTRGRFSIGLLTSKVYLTTPLIKNKWNISTALRTSYFDLMEPFQNTEEPELGSSRSRALNVRDFTIKNTYRLNERSKVTLNYLYTKDADKREEVFLSSQNDEKRSWSNHLLSGQYNRAIGSNSYLNVSAGYYRYSYNYSNKDVFSNVSDQEKVDSDVDELSLHSRFRGIIGNVDYTFGLQYYYTKVEPLALQMTNPKENFSGSIPPQSLQEVTFYQEAKYNFEHARIRLGNRLSSFRHKEGNSLHILPRVGLYSEWNNHQFSLEFDRNHQSTFTSSPISLGVPLDIWIMRNRPAISQQWTLGWAHDLSDQWHTRINLFHKSVNNHIELGKVYQRLDRDLLDLANFVIDDGRIQAYGIESTIKYESKIFSQLINLTYQSSQTQFDRLNQGVEFPTSFVRSLMLTTNSQWRLGQKWELGTSLTYSTGQPITLPVNSYFRFSGFQKFIFDDRNNAWYPDYFRLDLLLRWKKSKRSSWTFSVYNATAHQNPFHIILENDTFNGDFLRSFYKSELLFTILPTISYARDF